MSVADRLAIENAFKEYDANGNGNISSAELGQLCAKLGSELSEKELEDAVDRLDTDGSGEIELSEFMRWWLEAKNGDDEGGALDAKLAEIAATGKKVHFVDVHTAAWKGDAEAMTTLLQRDASLARAEDETDYGELNTPLHYAAYNGHEDVCRALLSAGAQADAPNETGCTPMFFAAQQGHLEVVKLLKGRGASVTAKERSVHKLSPVDVALTDEIREFFLQDANLRPPATPAAPFKAEVTKTGAVFIDWVDPPREKLPVLSWKVLISEVKDDAAAGDDEDGDDDDDDSDGAAGGVVPVGEWTTSGEVTEIQVEGLASGATYVVQLAATNTMGSSKLSEPSEPFTVVKPPSRPSNLKCVSATATEVTIEWRASHARGSELRCYRAQSRHNSEAKYDREQTVVVDPDVTQVVLPVKRPGKTFFRVFALNGVGLSKPANELMVMVPKPNDYGHGLSGITRAKARAGTRRTSRASFFEADAAVAADATPRSARSHASRSSRASRASRAGRSRAASPQNDGDDGAGGATEAAGRAAEPRKPRRPAPRSGAGGASRGRGRRQTGVAAGAGGGQAPVDVSGWDNDEDDAQPTPLVVDADADVDVDAGFKVNRLSGTARQRLVRQHRD